MEPRDAATVLLVRDAATASSSAAGDESEAGTEGIEVFMLRRNPRSVFVAGAYVFPGGAVDLEDRARATFELVDGIDDETASARLGREEGGLAFWVAAIRETFEEAGVLLARHAGSRQPVDASLAAELEPARGPVAAGAQSFARLVDERGLVLDGGTLRVLSHWVTPSPAPRRYDTWFFVAPAPPDHLYLHDDDETVASEWIETSVALERSRRGEIDLIYPTFRTLQAISRFRTVDELLRAIDESWSDPRVRPAAVNGWQVPLPGDELDDAAREADARAHSVTGRPRKVAG